MGKPSKSSASAGTRKKQIRKAAARDEDNQPQQQQSAKTKGGKKNKKEPRVKMYIPPTKPQPLQRDPIDVLGLGSVLPADLLVVLRRLMKKDAVTKQKALEELQASWIDKACRPPKSHEDPQGELVGTLCMALPVWVRLRSSLLQSLRALMALISNMALVIRHDHYSCTTTRHFACIRRVAFDC